MVFTQAIKAPLSTAIMLFMAMASVSAKALEPVRRELLPDFCADNLRECKKNSACADTAAFQIRFPQNASLNRLNQIHSQAASCCNQSCFLRAVEDRCDWVNWTGYGWIGAGGTIDVWVTWGGRGKQGGLENVTASFYYSCLSTRDYFRMGDRPFGVQALYWSARNQPIPQSNIDRQMFTIPGPSIQAAPNFANGGLLPLQFPQGSSQLVRDLKIREDVRDNRPLREQIRSHRTNPIPPRVGR